MSVYYEKYCDECKRLGFEPTMSKKEIHEAWGVKDEEEPSTFIARQKKKKGVAKNTIPTFEAYEFGD